LGGGPAAVSRRCFRRESVALHVDDLSEGVQGLDQVGRVCHHLIDVLVCPRDLVQERIGVPYSIPVIAARSSSWVNRFRAADRESRRPAPCGEECSATGLSSPDTTYDAVPLDPGINPSSP
jgi:hypothetical protein